MTKPAKRFPWIPSSAGGWLRFAPTSTTSSSSHVEGAAAVHDDDHEHVPRGPPETLAPPTWITRRLAGEWAAEMILGASRERVIETSEVEWMLRAELAALESELAQLRRVAGGK